MTGKTSLIADGKQVQTGVVQLGNDRPSVFIRGDNAAAYADYLQAAIDGRLDADPVAKGNLERLVRFLRAAELTEPYKPAKARQDYLYFFHADARYGTRYLDMRGVLHRSCPINSNDRYQEAVDEIFKQFKSYFSQYPDLEEADIGVKSISFLGVNETLENG